MITKLYTIRDRVAEESGPIFQAKNDGVAKRQFDQLTVGKVARPDEFVLLCLGTFDTETSLIFTSQLPEEVILTIGSEVE